MRFKNRIYVPDDRELKKLILREFHVKSYSGHPNIKRHWKQLKNSTIGRT